MTDKPRRPPKHLSPESAKLWAWIIATFELDPHHVEVATTMAEALDRLRQARELVDRDGLVQLDRFGQSRPHAALAIERDARAAFLRALRELDLDHDTPAESRPPMLRSIRPGAS